MLLTKGKDLSDLSFVLSAEALVRVNITDKDGYTQSANIQVKVRSILVFFLIVELTCHESINCEIQSMRYNDSFKLLLLLLLFKVKPLPFDASKKDEEIRSEISRQLVEALKLEPNTAMQKISALVDDYSKNLINKTDLKKELDLEGMRKLKNVSRSSRTIEIR